MKEKVFLVGLETEDNYKSFDVSMEELRALAESAGAEVMARIDQRGQVNPRTYIGSGKLREIKDMAENMEVDTIIFNSELSGSQIRNLEKETDKKIIDRTNLILDIFAQRARTKESVLQVSLAQAEYMLPRLEGYGANLSRTGGGIGTRGPGEQKLETDRRHIREQISRIKKGLKLQEKNRKTTSKRRNSSSISQVSLVGYTNVGKSTLMNRIIDLTEKDDDSKVYADDRLFATLETSHRRIEYENTDFILADTVGLIEDLPVNLIEAFKSTLEEVASSDLIIIVLDLSTDNQERQMSSIMKVIEDMQAGHINRLVVYNKKDLVDEKTLEPVVGEKSLAISAMDDGDVYMLLDKIVEELNKDKIRAKLLIPYKDADVFSRLIDKYGKEGSKALDEGMQMELALDKKDYDQVKKYEVD